MANIDQIVDKQFVQTIIDAAKALGTLDDAAIKYFQDLLKGKEATDQITKLQKELVKQTETLTQLDEKLNSDYVKNAAAINAKKKALADAIKMEGAAEGSLVRMRQKLSELTAAYDKAGTRTKEAVKEIDKLKQQIDKAEEATGRHQRSVGNYGKSFEALKNPIKIAGDLVRGFLANPFVAAIAGIAGAFVLLKNALSRTEEGQDKLNKVTNVFKSILDTAMNIISKVANVLFDAFSKPKETIKELGEFLETNLINRFKAFGEIGSSIVKIFSSDWKQGIKDLGQSFVQLGTGLDKVQQSGIVDGLKAMGNQFVDNAKKAAILAELENKYRKDLRADEKEDAKLQLESAELRAKAEELKKSNADEAIKLQGKAFDIDERILIDEKQLLKEKLEIAKYKQQINKDDIAARDEIAAIEAEIDTKEAEFNEKKRERLRTFMRLKKEAYAEEQQRQKAALQVEQTNAEATIANNNIIVEDQKKSLAERTAAVNANFEIQKNLTDKNFAVDRVLLDKELEIKFISQEDYNTQIEELEASKNNTILKLTTDKNNQLTVINDQETKKQQDLIKAQVEFSINENERDYNRKVMLIKATTKDKDEQNRKILELDKSITQNQIDILTASLVNFKGTEEEKLAIKNKIADAQVNLDNMTLETEISNGERRKKIYEQLYSSFKQITGAYFDFSEAKIAGDLTRLEQKNEKGLLSEKQYNKQKAELELKAAKNSRARGIFEATIGIAEAVVNALKVIPFFPLGLIMAGTAGILGGLQIGKILTAPLPTVPAFHLGGIAKLGYGTIAEKEPELMRQKSGKWSLWTKPGMFSGEEFKGARIYPGNVSKEMLSNSGHSGFNQNFSDTQIVTEIRGMRNDIKNINKPIYDKDHRIIGMGNNNHQQIYLDRYKIN